MLRIHGNINRENMRKGRKYAKIMNAAHS